MTTPAVKPSISSDLTPSETVLLYCDCFAPPPRQSRVAFETGIVFPFLLGMFFATAVVFSDPSSTPVWLRVVAAIADIALPVFWWLRRRRLDPAVYNGDIPVSCPLGGKRMAIRDELVGTALSAALLASEQAGEVELRVENGGLVAHFADTEGIWPTNSLEDQLRRERTIPVSELVYDWLADGSHFPYSRACLLIEHCARRRGLEAREPDGTIEKGASRSQAETEDIARAHALLNEARTQQPAVWKALHSAIKEGIKNREVPPQYEQVGRTRVPKYYYKELPIESLDAAEAAAPAPTAEATISAEEVPPKANPLAQTLVLVAVLCGLLFALWKNPENKMPALVNGAVMLLTLLVLDFAGTRSWQHLRAVRQSYGLAPESAGSREEQYRQVRESMTRADKATGWMIMAFLAALPGAIWGGWTVLIVLGLSGLLWLMSYGKLREFKESTAPEIVRTRLARMAETEPRSTAPSEVEAESFSRRTAGLATDAEAAPGPTIPDVPTPAHQLPPSSPGMLEVIERWPRRRSAYKLLQWKSFLVLLAGYVIIVLAFWNSPGKDQWIDPADNFNRYMPDTPFFLLALTAMFLLWTVVRRFQDRRSAVEEPSTPEEVGLGIWPLIATWRVLILLTAPLLFGMGKNPVPAHHLAFAASMLLFAGAHWAWTEWEIRRLMRAMPVPEPHRLVLLRVFGSPAFDDLVSLIQPWRRVGCIEHLEGFDTVGRSENVLSALDAGDIDRALVKTMPEIEAQFGSALYEPDRHLLFRRHAFQCTNTIWQEAVKLMLDRADAVLMDLSSLSFERQGCAWELGQLLNRVPLSKITLLVNDNTDMTCLRQILERAAQHMPEDSPNRNGAEAWQLISIGGLSARQPQQSYHDWKRRLDQRLDSVQLAAWLLSTAGSARSGRIFANSPAEMRYWRQSRWAWLALIILSGLWAMYLGK